MAGDSVAAAMDNPVLARHDLDGRRILNTVRAMQITHQHAANEAAYQALKPYLTLQKEQE